MCCCRSRVKSLLILYMSLSRKSRLWFLPTRTHAGHRNLPNIPLPENMTDLGDGQSSSTYVDDRSSDKVPKCVSSALLELHYVCLVQARSFGLLRPTGAIFSSIGGRVPTETMLELADVAGYSGRILTLWWKAQSEPESVIGGYAEHEKKGLGPVSPRVISLRSAKMPAAHGARHRRSFAFIQSQHSRKPLAIVPQQGPGFMQRKLSKIYCLIASMLWRRSRSIGKGSRLGIQ